MATPSIPGLTPGIVRTVALLQSWGFDTCDSGDGVTNVEAGMEGARPEPHVVMRVEPWMLTAEAVALSGYLKLQCGIELQPIGGDGPCLQASYDPATNVAILDLVNVDDALLARHGVDVVP